MENLQFSQKAGEPLPNFSFAKKLFAKFRHLKKTQMAGEPLPNF
jgi:hypothetical protein